MSCISGLAILALRIFGDLSAGFGESGLLDEQGILHLLTTFDCVFASATLDQPPVDHFEIARTSIIAAETPRFP